MDQVDEQLYDLSRGLVTGMGYTLVAVDEAFDHGRRTFRFTIDHARGISHDDCAAVSREIADLLDAEFDDEGGYVLEVSSAGLDHALKREREYAHFAGRIARLVLRIPHDGRNVLVGEIAGATAGTVRLTADGEEVSIPFENIARARLLP